MKVPWLTRLPDPERQADTTTDVIETGGVIPEELTTEQLKALRRPPLGSFIELPSGLCEPAFVASITERRNGDFVMHCIIEGEFGPLVSRPLGSIWHRYLQDKAREMSRPEPLLLDRPKAISPHWPWNVARVDLTDIDESGFDQLVDPQGRS